MKKVLLLPGWMTSVKLYRNNIGEFDMRVGKLSKEDLSAEYIIGVSLGALVVLRDIKDITGKVILINPPIPRRNIFAWLIRWLRYVKIEGLFLERQRFTTNPAKFILELLNCIKLLGIDFSATLDHIWKEKIIVIRGKDDIFFCDNESVKFLRSKNINVLEFDGGHNLSEKMEETLNNLII